MNKELLQEASQTLAIVDVFLVKSNCFINENWIPSLSPKSQLEIQVKNTLLSSRLHEANSDENTHPTPIVKYYYEVGFRFIDSSFDSEVDEENKVLGEVTAVFCCLYEKEKEISQEALDEFGNYNDGYHVWPYWREYAASMLSRLRLPHFILPLYKLPS